MKRKIANVTATLGSISQIRTNKQNLISNIEKFLRKFWQLAFKCQLYAKERIVQNANIYNICKDHLLHCISFFIFFI